MLALNHLRKVYGGDDQKVEALRGVTLQFPSHEFAAILGPSGCGKTTLLNIIGGLDHYTSGEMIISGKNTRDFTERDWDTYRNHRVGFVFQGYNLIAHQTVLQNVELALTLSGVGRDERRRLAEKALQTVGLQDQLHKKPNQLSGGQMQRVAIARALIGEPEIILADEPTGALDSETGVQVMELLKEISKDHLVIMVSHNAELVSRYADRIIQLKDGTVQSDSRSEEEVAPTASAESQSEKKPGMRFTTAIRLSLSNLLTKKARTILTAFAGSIGIIGIALILSVSNGVQTYINRVQEDTLSGYPLEIDEETVELSSMMTSFMLAGHENAQAHDQDKVYSNGVMSQMLNTMNAQVNKNDLAALKSYIEENAETWVPLVTDIRYEYDMPLLIYATDTENGTIQVNPSQVLSQSGLTGDGSGIMSMMEGSSMASQSMMRLNVFEELIDNEALLSQQFDVIAGRMPADYNELALIVDKNNEISDYTLYALGLRNQDEIALLTRQAMTGESIEIAATSYSYEDLLALNYILILPTQLYEKLENGLWTDRTDDPDQLSHALENGIPLKITGILRPNEHAVTTSAGAGGGVGYTSRLVEYVVEAIHHEEIVAAQKENPEVNVLTGLPFGMDWTDEQIANYVKNQNLPEMYKAFLQGKSDEEIAALVKSYMADALPASGVSYDDNMRAFGVSDLSKPSAIKIYARDFAAKESITERLDAYNKNTDEAHNIHYTDYVGMMMSSVTAIVDAISYVLIAFVAISLVVSSIMIGIITYISVLERTREIGILRAIGASRRDIRRVFNSETLLVGFTAGVIGIGMTLLLNMLINVILRSVTDVGISAVLPLGGAIILICISMLLTFIAGLIPSGIAARKDPVAALRTE